MKTHWTLLSATTLLCLAFAPPAASAPGDPAPEEGRIQASDLPAAVREEILRDLGSSEDALLFHQAKLTMSDPGSNDNLGWSSAVSGTTVVVGAPGKERWSYGAVYVYERAGGGWADMTQTAKLTVSDPGAADNLGFSVAIDGDTVVTGAYYKARGGIGSAAGAAYVFVRPPGGWTDMTESAKLLPTDGAAHDYFGYAIDVSGDTVVVGAYSDDNARGSAYVFEKPVTWAGLVFESAKLLASDGEAGELFGLAVGIDGDTIVCTEQGDTLGGNTWQGSAYVFEKPGPVWVSMFQTAKVTASDGEANDTFGRSAAISGNTVVIGAWADDTYTGSAYVYVRPGGGWVDATETAKLTASDRAIGEEFGVSVAIDGDTIAVGEHRDTYYGSDSGAVCVFEKPAGGWVSSTEDQELLAGDGSPSDWLGYSVGIDGDTVVAGAWGNGPPGPKTGSAYVFLRQTLASSTFRTAGANPASYSADPPVLGASWNASVDLTLTGHTHAQVLGYSAPASAVLPGGQVLLVGGIKVFTLPLRPGPSASWSVPIPDDPGLVGRTVHSQAAHLFGVAPFALSNAQDLLLGY